MLIADDSRQPMLREVEGWVTERTKRRLYGVEEVISEALATTLVLCLYSMCNSLTSSLRPQPSHLATSLVTPFSDTSSIFMISSGKLNWIGFTIVLKKNIETVCSVAYLSGRWSSKNGRTDN